MTTPSTTMRFVFTLRHPEVLAFKQNRDDSQARHALVLVIAEANAGEWLVRLASTIENEILGVVSSTWRDLPAQVRER
jgi:hypothetical protein